MQRVLGLTLAIIAVGNAAIAEVPISRAAKQAKDVGVSTCVAQLDKNIKFVYSDDNNYSQLATWSKSNPNGSAFDIMTASKSDSDNAIATFSISTNSRGKCDIIFTQIIPEFTSTCATLRDTIFKEWKYFNDLNGSPVYQEMTGSNVVLSPLAHDGCLIVKHVMLLDQ